MSQALSAHLYYFLRAGVKATLSKVRAKGLVRIEPRWSERAAICERCPMRVIQCGKSYCGKPFLQLPVRDQTIDGCGCPTHAKAKDPAEHCPLTADNRPAGTPQHDCNCKWCNALR
jgi:hypothetical protein